MYGLDIETDTTENGLDYSMWVATAAIVLIDWSALLHRVVARRPRTPAVA